MKPQDASDDGGDHGHNTADGDAQGGDRSDIDLLGLDRFFLSAHLAGRGGGCLQLGIGFCLGGGMELAIACDVIVAGQGAQFGPGGCASQPAGSQADQPAGHGSQALPLGLDQVEDGVVPDEIDGSGALTLRRAIIVAAIFEFGGAMLVGGTVTNTIRKGIIDRKKA